MIGKGDQSHQPKITVIPIRYTDRSFQNVDNRLTFIDQFGNLSSWTVREDSGVLWVSKDRGPALLSHNGYVQIIRAFDGRIWIRPSAA